jgi:hypothetical protein
LLISNFLLEGKRASDKEFSLDKVEDLNEMVDSVEENNVQDMKNIFQVKIFALDCKCELIILLSIQNRAYLKYLICSSSFIRNMDAEMKVICKKYRRQF